MGTFDIRLEFPAGVAQARDERVHYDEELDDVRSILSDIGRSLHDVQGASLTLTVDSGVPVSVRRDLCVVLEQLEDTLRDLRQSDAAGLELYEQGVDLHLKFVKADDGEVTVERSSFIRSDADVPVSVRVPRNAVISSLCELGRAFLAAAKVRNPKRTAHPWFKEWAARLEQELAASCSDL